MTKVCPSRHDTSKCRPTFPIAILMHYFTHLVRNRRLEELGELTHPKVILQTCRKMIPPAKAINHEKERRWGNEKPHFKCVAADNYQCVAALCLLSQLSLELKKNPRYLCTIIWRLCFVTKFIPLKNHIPLVQHFHRWCCFPAVSCLQTKQYAAIQITNTQEFLLAVSNWKEE